MKKATVLQVVCGVGLATALNGCSGTTPSIGVSDARVVETRHLGEIQRDIALRADLMSGEEKRRETAEKALNCRECLEKTYGQRRFVAESVSRLWMNPKGPRDEDPFLQFLAMERQRTAIAASVSELKIRLDALMTVDSVASAEPEDKNGDGAEEAIFSDLAKKFVESAQKLGEKSPVDSPTDALDRWHQIAMWYFVRHLAAHHDMRRADRATEAKLCDDCTALAARRVQEPPHTAGISRRASEAQPTENGWRYVVLVFEVHVNPGSQPNRAVGVRLKPVKSYTHEAAAWNDLTSARTSSYQHEPWGTDSPAPKLLITELFPTRVYDLEEAAALEEQNTAAEIDAKAQNVSIGTTAQRAQHEQRRFLTRTGKHASFADATTGVFGWDFYPSNFQRFEKGLPETLATVIWGRHPGGMEAYLEAGGRTCVAFALVDSRVNAILFEVTQVVKDAPPRTNWTSESSKQLGYFVLPLNKAGDDMPPSPSGTMSALVP